MNRPFAIYSGALDADELGCWRFGAGGGRLDGVVGPAFTNFGADPTDRGYHFIRANGDYMDAAFAGQPQRAQLTFECWVSGWWQVPTAAWSYRDIGDFYMDDENFIQVQAHRHDPATSSCIAVRMRIRKRPDHDVLWQGVEVDTFLANENRWHVAAVLDSPNSLRLFVNGERKAQDLVNIHDLRAGNYTLRLGRYLTGAVAYDLDGILDEVRLSKVARYAADFPITRFGEGQRVLARGPGDGVQLGGVVA